MQTPFVDIHCHLLPAVDDGPRDVAGALAMAQMAVADGTTTLVVTPHQLGSYSGRNRADDVRRRTADLQSELRAAGIPLTLLPGGDVRIEQDLPQRIAMGDALTLGDQGRHLLLELPHELYLPLEELLATLQRHGITGILSHPERNAGLLARPEIAARLVDAGCLMQVTAGSFTGAFGPQSQALAERMVGAGLVHFVASDGHGVESRRPRLSRAFDRVAELAGEPAAVDLCCRFPASVAAGQPGPGGRRPTPAARRTSRSSGWRRFFTRTEAA
ncbi:MAG TPA: CpsB/CapC family capsule biosynthesis tyrosine phosphatase [Lacipirellulaceae bacterium]|nr:CpsB/CapC family capsule biosynthesis tyrosine phosphatase [Lacipirellulaceae bacterium]